MLELIIPDTEAYCEATNEFSIIKGQTLQLEHSLVSISKWESKWHKPFLSSQQSASNEEVMHYIQCMTITENVSESVFNAFGYEQFKEINDYINNPMTATTFKNRSMPKSSQKFITSELIYYWMVALEIPFECETWHLNRLLTLIRVCNEENSPKKKMSKKDLASSYRALNDSRRKAMNTRG